MPKTAPPAGSTPYQKEQQPTNKLSGSGHSGDATPYREARLFAAALRHPGSGTCMAPDRGVLVFGNVGDTGRGTCRSDADPLGQQLPVVRRVPQQQLG